MYMPCMYIFDAFLRTYLRLTNCNVCITAPLSLYLSTKTANEEMSRKLEAAEKSVLEEAFVKLKQEFKDRNKKVNASIVLP